MRRVVSCLLVFAALAGACGERSAPSRRTIVDSRDNYDPRSLDPALSTDVPTGRAVAYVFDGLTRFTPDAQVQPALAERWELMPSETPIYQFHIRRGVKFHDGTTLVARHVIASWERALAPSTKGGRAEPLLPILGARDFAAGRATSIRGLRAPDDSTLIVALEHPLGFFPKLLAMPVASVVPPGLDPARPIGTGPWRFVEWKHDDYLLFARNDAYWGGAPATDSLRARIIAEPSTAVAEFESGNVDILLVPANDTRRWEESGTRAVMMSVPALQLVYIAINTTRGPLADTRVRRAINLAIDRREIVQRLISGRGRLAAGVIPPSLGGADTTRAAYPFGVALAKQLLADAGHASGIDVELWVGSNPVYARIAEAAQGYLAAANIRAKIVQRESAAAREAARNGVADMFLKDWYADYPDAENFLYPLLHSTNKGVGGNVSFFANAEFDKLVALARAEPEEGKRNALYRQADALAFDQAPMVFLYFYNELYAVQPWLSGFAPPVIFNGQRWLTAELGGRRSEGGAR
jgi:peptide/nickel transport system substrate-binding protein/oligopeptide transport system substrate-binding protein